MDYFRGPRTYIKSGKGQTVKHTHKTLETILKVPRMIKNALWFAVIFQINSGDPQM